LALNKVAYQSSTWNGGVASLANDGNPTTASYTENWGNNPWWAVDLGAPYDVEHVIVTNEGHPQYGN